MKVIEGFDSLVLNIQNSGKIRSKKVTKKEKEPLIRKGFYEGQLLGCTNYFLKKKKLQVTCEKCSFFDLVLKKFQKPHPKILNANAILEFKDSVILMKRGKEVYSYRNYWDFPASLVLHNRPILSRLKERILLETGIRSKSISFSKNPVFITVNERFFSIYYLGKVKLTSKEISNLQNNSEKNRIILLKKSKLKSFLQKTNIYPRKAIETYLLRLGRKE